jgi:DNA-binding CsgD family transcriptional regulator
LGLALLARVRVRRGDPGVDALLSEARAILHPADDLDQLGPVAVAEAEAALLRGTPEAVCESTQRAFEVAGERGGPWWLGELACLRRRAGIEDELEAEVAEPFALELAGDHEGAAAAWSALGCPYDAALALAASEDEESLRRALRQLQDLDARPAAAAVTRTLRERAARGPRASTLENPAELTPREVEVLTLIAEGLRNTDIAERLVVSERTVHHHVSAILRKLGVRSRAEAIVAAGRFGLTPQR